MAFVHGASENPVCPKGLYTGQVTFIRGPDGQLGDLGYPTPFPHGNGSMVCLEGGLYSNYVGQWFEGQRKGRGVTMYRNNDIYSGQYENDRRHGIGTYTNYKQNFTNDLWYSFTLHEHFR